MLSGQITRFQMRNGDWRFRMRRLPGWAIRGDIELSDYRAPPILGF